jgi:hypothetical protein
MDTKDLILSTCAVVGAVLGVFNLARSYLSDSERLTVARIEGDDKEYPGVEIVNRSPFPITVAQLGMVYPDGQVSDVTIAYIRMGNIDQPQLPRRIEARTSHLFRVTLRETIAQQVHRPKYTYARTGLGKVFTAEHRLTRWCRRAMECSGLKKPDL